MLLCTDPLPYGKNLALAGARKHVQRENAVLQIDSAAARKWDCHFLRFPGRCSLLGRKFVFGGWGGRRASAISRHGWGAMLQDSQSNLLQARHALRHVPASQVPVEASASAVASSSQTGTAAVAAPRMWTTSWRRVLDHILCGPSAEAVLFGRLLQFAYGALCCFFHVG